MDMTPMVDVTFLLLIFFMVTASFTFQAAMDFRPKASDEASTRTINQVDQPPFVTVAITAHNEFRVMTHDGWVDAPNRHELQLLLSEARTKRLNPEKLLIVAHADCLHQSVVQAMDIAIDLEYKIQIKMSNTDQL